MKKKQLHRAVIAALASSLVAMPAVAQQTPPASPTVDCGTQGCSQDGEVLMRVRTRGKERPKTEAGTPDKSAALQPDRRVTVEAEQMGRATAVGKWSVQLPNGGVVWATEDPNLGRPALTMSANSMLPFDGTRITKPVSFYGYSNYGAFIKRADVLVFDARDADLVTPLATIPLQLGTTMEAEWNGALDNATGLRVGDELIYVVRAWSDDTTYDETFPQRMQLLRPEEVEAANLRLQNTLDSSRYGAMTAEAAERLRQIETSFGQNSLNRQNIPVYGSQVRLQGRNIPEGAQLRINGQNIPVDLERKFVVEYLLPIGQHGFDVEVEGGEILPEPIQRRIDVDVTGRYFFAVALADLTYSRNSVSGSVEAQNPDGRFDKDSLTEGRLAFYLKGKAKGRYLITAQADTEEREISRMFTGFGQAYPQDVFRRLDPDRYYPVYGDDSTLYRDVDTMGKFYLRVDWDQNQALWGNYNTGLTGTEFAQYSRSLYGAAFSWRSARTTETAEPGSFVRVFGSQTQSAPGHSEFIGTGGSLYYLKHTDVLPGSDKVTLEVRDGLTGRVEARVEMVRGVDYEIDEYQGRIILTRPLAQVTRENVHTITRDTPLDGYSQILLVDYEYVPTSFHSDEIAAGVRGKHWFGEHVGVGGTYVEDNSGGDDYRLMGADVTFQAGRGTYLKLEQAKSRATSAPVFFSDNGGLSFTQLNPLLPGREGTARSVEARLNAKELGWTEREWSAGAWWRKVDGGFSIARYDTGAEIEESGVEVLGDVNEALRLYAKVSKAERGTESFSQAQVTADWRINDKATLSGELRRVEETRFGGEASGTLFAARYMQRVGSALDLYGIAQFTLDDDGGSYEKNNAVTAGAKYNFANLSTLGAEITAGDRGNAAQINGEWRVSPEHSFYGSYTYSTDTTYRDPLFNSGASPGWTLGQRWRLSNQVNLFNESQFLKAPNESGLAHTFGMDFYPALGWNAGFSLQKAELDRQLGQVDRDAISVFGGRTSEAMQWQSKLEYRRDSGLEQRKQWVTTNWLSWKASESWRWAARFNYSDTKDELNALAGAKFAEGNVGFAWRPWNNAKYALFGKYTYLYDVSSLPQVGPNVAYYDQRSQILSIEGVYHPSHNWEFAGKLARREGDVRMGRLTGQWLDSATSFAAIQARYGIGNTDWNFLGEYRWLKVDNGGGVRNGALLGVDRDISKNFRVGIGYNFTDFSDDLTNFDYDHKGWFLNVVGRY